MEVGGPTPGHVKNVSWKIKKGSVLEFITGILLIQIELSFLPLMEMISILFTFKIFF